MPTPKKRKPKLSREQLAIQFEGLLQIHEKSFIKKLGNYYTKLTRKIVSNVTDLATFHKSLKLINKTDIDELKNLINNYHRQVGKTSIKRLNAEIKELTGISSKISIPDIHEGLRYRAEQLAKEHVREFKKQLKEQVKNSSGTIKEKSALWRTIRKASKVFQTRHITITSRMESVAAANTQRLEAGAKSTIVKGWQFLAVIDNKTTYICSSRHLHVLPVGSQFLKDYTPPCHFGCRSLLSPVTIFEKDVPFTLTEDLKRVPKPFSKKLSRKELIKIVNKQERDILNKIGKEEREMSVILDPYGNIIFSKDGLPGREIKFTDKELTMMQNAAVVTHNHPSSGTFSIEDISLAFSKNIEELRIIAPNNKIKGKGVFVARGLQNIPQKYKDNIEILEVDLLNIYSKYKDKVKKDFSYLVWDGKIKKEQFKNFAQIKAWEEMAKHYNFNFFWEPLN